MHAWSCEIPAILAFPLTQLPPAGTIYLTDGTLPAGMEYPALHLAVLSEGQLLRKKPARRPKAPVKASNRQKLRSFTDLTPGDLVVHTYHGIGRYEGMEQMKLDGVVKDYIKISYQGTDVLYVPATQLDLVSKYIGAGENGAVRLNKLGTDAWEKTKAKAKKSAKDMAAKLIKRAMPFRRIRPGRRSLRRTLPMWRRTISCAASPRSSRICSSPRRWTGFCAAMSALVRQRSRCGRR